MTGIVGDTRQYLSAGDDLYGLALAAWTSQGVWPMQVLISFFSELERLWPRPQNWSPLDEPRARVAAKLLMNTNISRAEIAAEFGIRSDTLRRRGVWRRVDEIIANRGPHPMQPTPDGRGITRVVGEVGGPGAGVVAVTLSAADGGSPPRTIYYDRDTVLPRVWRLPCEDVPSSAGHRFLPVQRRSRGGARDVRDVYRAGDRLRSRARRPQSDGDGPATTGPSEVTR
jgi:hypothetical protein